MKVKTVVNVLLVPLNNNPFNCLFNVYVQMHLSDSQPDIYEDTDYYDEADAETEGILSCANFINVNSQYKFDLHVHHIHFSI